MEPDRYLTPMSAGQAEFTERHSRFLGRVWPVETEAEALRHLAETRERHWDASHNVYCYRIRSAGVMRYSDDGEPQGTAGLPSLNVFLGNRLENFCCVVTRYFGGILLGTGGLVRAYSHAARLALDAAGIAEWRLWQRVLISCAYGQYERLRSELQAAHAVIEETDFGTDVLMTVLVPQEETPRFSRRVTDITAGTVGVEPVDTQFRACRVSQTTEGSI